jgi:hypothetical protein
VSLGILVYAGGAAVVGLGVAVVLTKWRKKRTQEDDELLSEMATHLWNLPPPTPPIEEGASLDLRKAKVPSLEQHPGSPIVGPEVVRPLGERRSPLPEAGPKQSEAILDRMSKSEDAARAGPEATQSNARVPNVVRREGGPEPTPAEFRETQQGPRLVGRHQLMWETVGAATHGPKVWPQESEAAAPGIEQTRQPVPSAGTAQPDQGALKELDRAASNLLEQTRRRLDEEVLATLETLRHEADARLRALEEGHLSLWVAKLQAEITEKTQGQINDLRESCHRSLESVSERLQGRVKEQLDLAASGVVEQMRGRLQGEVAAALETFSRQAGARRLRALEEGPLTENLQAEMTAQVQKELSNLRDTAREVHEDLRQRADAAVEKIGLAAEAGAGKLQTFEHQMVVRFGEVIEALKTTADDLVGSSATRLKGQAVATKEQMSEELRALQRSLVEEAGKQLGAVIQTPLESLTGKAEAISEECRRRLRQELDERVQNSLRQLEADSRKFLENQRESVQRFLDERLAAAIQASRASLKRESQTIMVECRDRLLQEVDAAVAASARKLEGEREKLPVRPHEPVVSSMEFCRPSPPELPQESTPLPEGLARLRALLHPALRAAVWLIPVAPILLFAILSVRPVIHLRADPPAEFMAARPDLNAMQRATEERLARAYWSSAIKYVQSKYEFGTNLPNEPVPEFKLEATGPRGGKSKSDSDTRTRYWQRLRQVWIQPQAWQKSYVWDTGWIDATLTALQRAGR